MGMTRKEMTIDALLSTDMPFASVRGYIGTADPDTEYFFGVMTLPSTTKTYAYITCESRPAPADIHERFAACLGVEPLPANDDTYNPFHYVYTRHPTREEILEGMRAFMRPFKAKEILTVDY
jgi:hypothetical protein